MNVSEQISRLSAVKARIRNAITVKGVAVPTDAPFFNYADFIRLIEGGSDSGTANHVTEEVGIIYWMPWEVHGLDEIELPERVYSEITETPLIQFT